MSVKPESELAKWIHAVTAEIGLLNNGFMREIDYLEVLRQANGPPPPVTTETQS